MTGECGSCGRDKTLKARGLCSNCRNRSTLDGTLGNYGWVRVNRLAEFSELRERHYPVEVAGARVGVSARTAWRYEAALRSGGWPVERMTAPVSPERAERNLNGLGDGLRTEAATRRDAA